jgi:hypothetical protein
MFTNFLMLFFGTNLLLNPDSSNDFLYNVPIIGTTDME